MPSAKQDLIGAQKSGAMATSCLAISQMEEVEGGDWPVDIYSDTGRQINMLSDRVGDAESKRLGIKKDCTHSAPLCFYFKGFDLSETVNPPAVVSHRSPPDEDVPFLSAPQVLCTVYFFPYFTFV